MSCQVCTSMLLALRQWIIEYQTGYFNESIDIFKIIGSPDNFGTSTIKTQFLSFDVSFFKSVEELEVYFYSFKNKNSLEILFFSLIVFKPVKSLELIILKKLFVVYQFIIV